MTPRHLQHVAAYRQALVQAYRQAGGPVSRQQVARQMPQVNPATVRRWMERLCRMGLAQKVPDSWGWRFVPVEVHLSPLALARSARQRVLAEQILMALSAAEYSTVDEVARTCGLSASRTRYMLARLERLGLAQRVKRGVWRARP